LMLDAWTFDGKGGYRIHSPHYLIYTTIDDKELMGGVAEMMEGALLEYRKLTPGVPLSDEPMDCYFFAQRPQWATFTRKNTGPDAAIYLQIVRGGYTLHDVFVAYFIGDYGTFSVAAHEGWHQYVARHFKGRLPPFLEEGIACMFENVTLRDGVPVWNWAVNPSRSDALRRAVEHHRTWPLEQLVTMHAGEVVDQAGDRIEAFYAQDWAFARFLWEAEGGRYRPALQKLLADTAAGTVHDPTRSHQRHDGPWDPAGVQPILEYYLNMPMDQIAAAYWRYVREALRNEPDAAAS